MSLMLVDSNGFNEDKMTGEVCIVVLPSPSSPNAFRPQHATEPLSRVAHTWDCPTARSTARRFESISANVTGEFESV